MRNGTPASKGYFRIRFSLFDTVWALGSPMIALAIRADPILTTEAAVYWFISVAFTLIAYSAFRLHDGVSKFFSVHDAWNVVRAVASAELMSCLVLFTLTRLEHIPRSTPLIHALILCAGLIAIRAFPRLREVDSGVNAPAPEDGAEHVVMIGATKLSFLFMKFLAAYCPGQRRVIALLDDGPRMVGRTMFGTQILGPPNHLQLIIDELAEHGLSTDRVVVGGDEELLSQDTLNEVQRVCEQRQIPLDFVPQLVGLSALEPEVKPVTPTRTDTTLGVLSPYFKWKYVLDFVLATTLLVLLAPFLMLAAGLILVDVGSPILFWQQRLGAAGRRFTIYKLRTLRPPFDQLGKPIPEDKRLSWVGSFLRRSRLDELPQLFNVLVGEMSLIGPRPLLPHDQPANTGMRFMIRPGITGWAQVNGGTLLTPTEKLAFDEWYARNASVWIDVRIIMKTLKVMMWGQSRPEHIQPAEARRRDSKKPIAVPAAQWDHAEMGPAE